MASASRLADYMGRSKQRLKESKKGDKHRSQEAKDRKRKKRVRSRKIEVDHVKKEFSRTVRLINSSGKYLFQSQGYEFGRAVFLKDMISQESCQSLATHLLEDPFMWEFRKEPKRGDKDFIITGKWAQQGHGRPGIDHSYTAGKAGNFVATSSQYTNFNDPMVEAGKHLTSVLNTHRPDLKQALDELPDSEKIFGTFPLFMAAKGAAGMHSDSNDLVSFLILLSTSENCGGGLEIGGSGCVFNWKIGDGIILDSALLPHGTCNYIGDLSERIVGIWIIHKRLLRLYNISFE